MMDQAETLRKMMRTRGSSAEGDYSYLGPESTRSQSVPVLTMASGKGGVGKSCLTANLATLLARSGLRVMLVDGDFGLANLDILLGVQAGATLEQVLAGDARLQDAVIGVEPNLWLVPASSGILEMKNASSATRERLAELFEQCPWEMDLILVDVGAGIQPNVLSLHSPAFRSLIMLTPEPTALMDAYGLIKLLNRHSGVGEFHIVVNQVTDEREARQIFQKFKDVADRFIDVRMEYLGHWIRDEKVKQAVMNRKILIDYEREAASITSLRSLAMNLQSKFIADFMVTRDLQESLGNGDSWNSNEVSESSLARVNISGNTRRFWKTLFGYSSELQQAQGMQNLQRLQGVKA